MFTTLSRTLFASIFSLASYKSDLTCKYLINIESYEDACPSGDLFGQLHQFGDGVVGVADGVESPSPLEGIGAFELHIELCRIEEMVVM